MPPALCWTPHATHPNDGHTSAPPMCSRKGTSSKSMRASRTDTPHNSRGSPWGTSPPHRRSRPRPRVFFRTHLVLCARLQSNMQTSRRATLRKRNINMASCGAKWGARRRMCRSLNPWARVHKRPFPRRPDDDRRPAVWDRPILALHPRAPNAPSLGTSTTTEFASRACTRHRATLPNADRHPTRGKYGQELTSRTRYAHQAPFTHAWPRMLHVVWHQSKSPPHARDRPQSRLASPEIGGPDVANLKPTWGRSRPAEAPPQWAKLHRSCLRGRLRAKFGQHRAKLGRCRPESVVVPTVTCLGPNLVKAAPNGSILGQIWSIWVQLWRKPPQIGGNQATLHQSESTCLPRGRPCLPADGSEDCVCAVVGPLRPNRHSRSRSVALHTEEKRSVKRRAIDEHDHSTLCRDERVPSLRGSFVQRPFLEAERLHDTADKDAAKRRATSRCRRLLGEASWRRAGRDLFARGLFRNPESATFYLPACLPARPPACLSTYPCICIYALSVSHLGNGGSPGVPKSTVARKLVPNSAVGRGGVCWVVGWGAVAAHVRCHRGDPARRVEPCEHLRVGRLAADRQGRLVAHAEKGEVVGLPQVE